MDPIFGVLRHAKPVNDGEIIFRSIFADSHGGAPFSGTLRKQPALILTLFQTTKEKRSTNKPFSVLPALQGEETLLFLKNFFP